MKRSLGLTLISLLCSASVYGQTVAGTGAVTGTVRDDSGDGMPDSTVVLYNQALGIRRTILTTDDGVFDAPALAPSGTYRLKVTRKGFANWESTDFAVAVGQTLNLQIALKAEGAATQVEAAAAIAPVDDTRVGVSTLVTRSQIEGLSANERRPDPLVPLAPGVVPYIPGGVLAFRGLLFSNALLTDGLLTTDTYYFDKPGIANQLPLDAVEQFQVLVSGPSPEFGRAAGGIVNAATRSGGNSFHGDAYGYRSTHGLAAADRFANGQNLFNKQNEAGASVGGPILPGRVFFFFNGDVLDGSFQDINRITSPLIADSMGTSVLASNCKAVAVGCAAAIQYIQPQMNVQSTLSQRWASGVARLDYRGSARSTIGVEANLMNARFPDVGPTGDIAPNGGLLGLVNTQEQTRYYKAYWTYVPLRAAFNELRAGMFEDTVNEPASQANLPGGNLTVAIANVQLGPAHPYSSSVKERRYQGVDNFSITTGSHSFKGGADVSLTQDTDNEVANSAGTYFYPSLTAFATDLGVKNQRNYSAMTQTVGTQVPSFRIREIHAYVQDTWKANSHFMMTFGVRWEKWRMPQQASSNSYFFNFGVVPSPNLDLAPRFSASYMLDDRTVFRAGYGWYFAPFPGQLVSTVFGGDLVNQTSITVTPTAAGAPIFPNVFTATSTLPGGTMNEAFALAKFHNPYSGQMTFALERRVTRDTAVTLSLMHDRTNRMWVASDVNLAASTVNETYNIYDASNTVVSTFSTPVYTTKTDNSHGHIYQIEAGGSAWYNAAALQVRKQMGRTLSVQLSYTFSHATDDVNGPALFPGVPGIPSYTSDGDYIHDKGNSNADQKHRAVLNWVWQPTIIKNNSLPVRFLLNGWVVSGVATAASSLFETPLVYAAGQQFSGVTLVYPGSLNGSGGWNRASFEKVNSLRTAPQYNLDARLTRTLPFTERVRGMVMIEAFNALNRQSITSVNTAAYTATAGALRPIAGLGTGNASNGFPFGLSARRLQVGFRLSF